MRRESEPSLLWVLESDRERQRGFRQALEPHWDLVFWSSLADCEAAIAGLESRQSEGISAHPAAVLLELVLSDGNAFRRIQRPDSELRRGLLDRVPWVVVSATSDLDTIRACFANGAADYLTTPYRDAELLIRVERMLSKAEACATVASLGGDEWAHVLTPKERRIFDALASAQGEPVTRTELIEKVWRGIRVSPNGLDVHLHRLRGKIAERGWTIEAQKGGEGWVLRTDCAQGEGRIDSSRNLTGG